MELNPLIFEFAEKGYSPMSKGVRFGAKAHSAFCTTIAAPIALEISSGDVHDSKRFERLVRKISRLEFLDLGDLILVFDKALVVSKRDDGEKHELLTNIWDLSPEEIVLAYKQRWDIEVLHKDVKQYFSFKHPLGRSWNAFQVHVYIVNLLHNYLFLSSNNYFLSQSNN